MTIESEFFKIEPLYNSGYGDTRYVVSWPNRGMVSKESSVMSIWRFAFDTGAFQVGFANSHDCLWVDAIVDMQAPECDAYMVIKRLGEIDRISLQRNLPDAGVKLLNPDGLIAYVTCSPHRSETTAQVADFLYRHKDFQLLSLESYIPESAREMDILQSDGSIQMWSDIHGTDSMFMALFSRIQS